MARDVWRAVEHMRLQVVDVEEREALERPDASVVELSGQMRERPRHPEAPDREAGRRDDQDHALELVAQQRTQWRAGGESAAAPQHGQDRRLYETYEDQHRRPKRGADHEQEDQGWDDECDAAEVGGPGRRQQRARPGLDKAE